MGAPFTVLKQGEIFVVSDERGDIGRNVLGAGVYFRDTRYLSEYRMTLTNGLQPELLDASAEHNSIAVAQFGNPYFEGPDRRGVLPNTVSVRRYRIVDQGITEQLELYNFNDAPVTLDLTLAFSADFRDIFDIRGFRRVKRGDVQVPYRQGNELILSYESVDKVIEQTVIRFNRPPDATTIEAGLGYTAELEELALLLPGQDRVAPTHVTGRLPSASLRFQVALEPHRSARIELLLTPRRLSRPGKPDTPAESALWAVPSGVAAERFTSIRTSNEVFDRLLDRSLRDLRTLITPFSGGRIVAAGIPWYVAPFGRDSLIVALQTLMFSPELAIETLRFLADRQGKKVNPWTEEQPGKVLHEERFGEMARRGEIPHVPYYGTIDATPLFIVTFCELMRWIGSRELYDEFRPAVEQALHWIDDYGDTNGDGFVDYGQRTRRGLVNRGWKDSDTSLPGLDGAVHATPPVALVEVQGYVFQAKRALAAIVEQYGDAERAAALRGQAEELRSRFEERFWSEEDRFYGQAVDGDGRLIPWITSNPGHCLYSGIVAPDRAEEVTRRLRSVEMYSGWGIRTLSTAASHYNPMSYHNGSVWPHDNALIVAGMRQYGFDDDANAVISDLIDAALHFDYGRFPELFCGFSREFERYTVPISYPVSCSPQAWAAGTIPFLLQVLLGLEPDAHNRRISLRPYLPGWLHDIQIRGMRFGDQRVDLNVCGRGREVEVSADVEEDIEVLVNGQPIAVR